MALGAKEAVSSIFSSYPSTSIKFHSFNKSLSSVRLGISISPPAASLKFTLYNLPRFSSSQPTKKPGFQLHSTVESASVEEDLENSRKPDNRRKLFVLNLPWSFSVADIKKLFSECGTVADFEIIKQKDGKNRGFAFVTMASGEEAQAAIEKYDSYNLRTYSGNLEDEKWIVTVKETMNKRMKVVVEDRTLDYIVITVGLRLLLQRFIQIDELVGRIIRVQFAKRFKKPAHSVSVSPPPRETRHKLYVSNLGWKVRSNNLREFFSSNFNPVSVRVVFDSQGRSAGYGFVSFATKGEAQSAISVLDGKELLGRPIRLKFSEKNSDSSESKEESNSDASESKEESIKQQPEGS